jgi:hypothetical protein
MGVTAPPAPHHTRPARPAHETEGQACGEGDLEDSRSYHHHHHLPPRLWREDEERTHSTIGCSMCERYTAQSNTAHLLGVFPPPATCTTTPSRTCVRLCVRALPCMHPLARYRAPLGGGGFDVSSSHYRAGLVTGRWAPSVAPPVRRVGAASAPSGRCLCTTVGELLDPYRDLWEGELGREDVFVQL